MKRLYRFVLETSEPFKEERKLANLMEHVAELLTDVSLVSLNYEGSPDPHLFEDPDNLPEGVE